MLKIVALMSKNDTFMLTLASYMLKISVANETKTTNLGKYINNERGI